MFSIRKDLAMFKKALGNQSNDQNKTTIKKTLTNTNLNNQLTKTINKIEHMQFLHHPALKYINHPSFKKQDFQKFVHVIYHGLVYSVKNLKGPSQEYLKKKSVVLPQPNKENSNNQTQNKKFLMLDLDQTLIHSIFDKNEPADVRIQSDGNQFRFNVRPYCLQFLQKMSEHYIIYVFTASTKDYAQPIVKYLNRKKKTIVSVLHRKNCMQTMNGFKIKDLRMIKNRSLDDIIIVDNLVHSFGLQLDNGIPILEYIDNKQDRQLIYLQKILLQAKDIKDVREFIRNRFNLRNILEHNQKEFLNIHHQKWANKNVSY